MRQDENGIEVVEKVPSNLSKEYDLIAKILLGAICSMQQAQVRLNALQDSHRAIHVTAASSYLEMLLPGLSAAREPNDE